MYFVEWYWRALSFLLKYFWFYVAFEKEESFAFIFECDFQDGVFVFYSQYGWFPYRMEDFDTQFEFRMLSLSFAYLLSVGFVIETRL